MAGEVYTPKPEQIYRGTYSVVECAHGCSKKIELGPRLKASWAWCAVCQRPTCKAPVCMSRCPSWGWLERWDQSQFRDFVADVIQDDPDRKQVVTP